MANIKEHIATKLHTGITIARNGKYFTVSWKFGDKDYGAGQTLKWQTNRDSWTKVSGVSKTTKTKSFSVNEDSYHPTSKGKYLDMLFIDLQGTRKKFTATKKIDGKNVQIDYIPQQTPDQVKSFAFYKPPKPSVSFVLGSNYYTCNLTINSNSTATDHYWVRKICYQTVLLTNSDITDGSKVKGWGAVTTVTGTTYSRTISESTSVLASGSHTRWVKVWTQGVNGNSDPVYVKHVYSAPNAVKSTKAVATKSASGVTFTPDP